MADVVQTIVQALHATAQQLDLSAGLRPRGVVRQVRDGVAFVQGLADIGYEELVAFDSGATGMAYDLGRTGTGVVLLSGADQVRAGEGVSGLHCLPALLV